MTPGIRLLESTEMVSHAAFRLVDDFTGRGPVSAVRCLLDQRNGSNSWVTTPVAPVVSASGILLYPFLEKKAAVIGAPSRRYRFRVESEVYQADYRADSDGIEFDDFPYNDDVLVNPYATDVQLVALHPSPTYAFPPEVPVLRGTILRQSNGKRVAFAKVTKGVAEETALSDERGEFVLPLRWIQNPQFDIDVVDLRTSESRTKTILVPDMLGINITIDIL